MNTFQSFDKLVREIHDLQSAIAVLDWDQNVNLPAKGTEDRARQIATLSRLLHQKKTAPAFGELVDELEHALPQYHPESYENCLIKKMRHEYNRNVKVPPTLVAELAQATSEGLTQWERAKAAADFTIFAPFLSTIVALKKAYAQCFKPYDHIYDALLDDFEPGMKTARIKAIFDVLRQEQVALVKKIAACAQVNDDFLHQNYNTDQQLEFSRYVIEQFGYDWHRGRMDLSSHPFQITFGANDARITTRTDPNYLNSAIFGTFHESGHAIYELGINNILAGTPLYDGASAAVHESQSRLWENIIGRSLEFWTHMYPELRKRFPRQLADIEVEAFHRGINKVTPSCIRIDADEATYNLHIMLRMDIEILLLEGQLEIEDLPEIWNAKMSEYLDVTPESHAQGVLQDIHWSIGLFGYFPSYAIGNVIASQVWEKIETAMPNLKDQIQTGDFSPLRKWLGENLHRHGAKFKPADLIQRVTGEEINSRAYMRYLNNKYGRLYGFE